MPRVVLATCPQLPDGDEDAPQLLAALCQFGLDARYAVWSDAAADWDADLVVLRSTWDYPQHAADFLAWTAGVPRLANAAPVVAWSADKTYLRDLAAAGLPTVPTGFAAPGEPVPVPAGPVVVKPSVGAGSRDVARFADDQQDAALAHARALHARGLTVLVQPYLEQVEHAGETALVYLDGGFSHAIRKGPMLPATGTPGRGATDRPPLYVPERITARVPGADEREVGDRVLAEVRRRFGADPLYARVDLLRSPDGPVVVELELVEPSLFLQHSDAAAERFAGAIAHRVGRRAARAGA